MIFFFSVEHKDKHSNMMHHNRFFDDVTGSHMFLIDVIQIWCSINNDKVWSSQTKLSFSLKTMFHPLNIYLYN